MVMLVSASALTSPQAPIQTPTQSSDSPAPRDSAHKAAAGLGGEVNGAAPLLEVQNLQVYFPLRKGFFRRATDYVRAVDNVSFTLYPGETIGLVGESGCGKTTLGRALLRLTEPTAGSILFEGIDLAKLSSGDLRRRRRDLQLVFQDP